MSLLNNMLRDLDKQTEGNTPAAPGTASAPVRRSGNKQQWLVALAALALGYFLVVEKNLLGLLPAQQNNYLEIPEPISINPKWLAAVEKGAIPKLSSTETIDFTETKLPVPAERETPLEKAPQPRAESEPSIASTAMSPAAQPAPVTDQAPGRTVSDTAAAAPKREITPPTSAPRVSLSSEERDHNIARGLNAQTLNHREDQAWQWLREGAVIDQTVFALADIYRAENNSNKLQALREQVAHRAPDLANYVLAQQALLNQDWPAAIHALSTVQLKGEVEAQRLRLLGGIFQNTQQYQQALEVYSQLVARRDAQANDWLGQAVAQDALGNRQAAREAFRRVHHMQHPDPQVNAYAQRRDYELSQSFLSR